MRQKFILIIIFCSLLFILSKNNTALSQTGRDPTIEQEILDRLAAINPAAVPLFVQATQDMDAGNTAAAKEGYEAVLLLAPGFPDAERRLSYVEADLGNYESALLHAQNAYNVDPTPFNQTALARALLNMNNPAKNQQAEELAKAAAQALPDDAETQMILVWAASANNDAEVARQANARFLELDPQNPIAHYFAAIHLAEDTKWERSEKEFLLAEKLGIPSKVIQEALDSGIRSQARLYRTLRWAGYTLAAWLLGFGILFLLGGLLSAATLRTVRHYKQSPDMHTGSLEKLVRWVYRLVIQLTSVYFYLSIPILLLLIIGFAVGIIYLFFMIGVIPIQLLVFVGITVLYTLYIVIRSLFIRIKETEPGRSLERNEAPSLWRLVEEVAKKVVTHPVEAIYITPGAEIAVTERGGILKKMRGRGQRCLVLGLGALNGMTQGQFRAILAHEYGHFTNRDTAGGNFARQVLVSVRMMGMGLAMNGLATWYNPAWWFVNGFHRIFLRITLGASRLQEILADRYAALAYGAQNFIDGLKHVIRQSVTFDFLVTDEIKGALYQNIPLKNLYNLPAPQTSEAQTQVETAIHEALNKPTGAYDSHPSLHDREALVLKIQAAPAAVYWDDPEPAWDLLQDVEGLKQEMTTVVQRDVDRQRLTLPEGSSQ
jgi:Zn-dependent protease with chaperone function